MITPPIELLKIFKETNGAMSVTEAVALYGVILEAPRGVYCELGVHKGKSATIMVAAMRGKEVVLVEPEFTDEKWLSETIATIQRAAKEPLLILPLADYSTNVLPDMAELAYCMVDSGSHQDGLPMQEVKMLEDKMIDGGVIAFHDWNSQFQEVKEAADYLVKTGKYEYIEIPWQEIVAYINENSLEEGNLSWHHTELKNPSFLAAVKKK